MATILVGAAALTIDRIKSKRAERKATEAAYPESETAQPSSTFSKKQFGTSVEQVQSRAAKSSDGDASRKSYDAPPTYQEKHSKNSK